MLKTLVVIAALFGLSLAAHAQDNNEQPRKFTPIKIKKLELNHLGKGATTGLKQFKRPDLRIRDSRKPVYVNSAVKRNTGMPIVAPDSTVLFPIMAVKPDPTIHFHIQYKNL